MIKTLLKVAVLAIIALLVYNYFLGDPEEKETSEKVFNEIKDLGVAVKDFVTDEHQRMKDGKYEKILDDVQSALTKLEAKAKDLDPETLESLKKLKEESESISDEVSKKVEEGAELSDEEKGDIESQIKKLIEKTSELIDEQGRRDKKEN